MLQLILGRAGFGKTYRVRKLLMEKIRLDQEKLMLIVPEQSSFENGKVMLNLLGAKGSRKLETTTFTRLVDFVSRKVGGFAGKRLDDGGRNMIMSLAIEEVRPYLDLYKKHSDKAEFIELMVDALIEFKTCGISKTDIDSVVCEISDVALKAKLKESFMIMSAYDAIVKQSYIDPIDDLTRLYEVLMQNDVFEGYTIVIDSFDGFTNQQMKVIECIMRQSKDFYVTLCTDSLEWSKTDFDLLSPIRKTAHQLWEIADRNNITVADPIRLESACRFYGKGITFLEENIFRAKKKSCEGNFEDVKIFEARDIYDEVDYVARTIRKLVIEENVRYRDFLVLTRLPEKYGDIIESVFQKYDIPVFMDRSEVIDSKTLMNLVLTALDVMISNFKSENVLKFLKTGLVSFSTEEISVLENYVLLWNVTGEAWLNDFELHPRGFVDEFTEQDVENLSLLNDIRNRVIKPFINFKGRVQEKTGFSISKSLYLFLLELDIEKNLMRMSDYFNSMNQKNLADEQIRLWDLLMSIFDQITLVLKNKSISLRRYKELLKVTFTSNEISFIPQGLDEVKFGSAERIRPSHPRFTFIVGAVRGEFPKHPVSKGIFSDSQRKKLISVGLEVREPLENMSVKEQFIAYRAITSPSERLYITWPQVGISGKANQPSSIVSETKKILCSVETISSFSEDKSNRLFSEKASFEECARLFKDDSVFASTLRKYFLENDMYQTKIDSFSKLQCRKIDLFVDKKISMDLFGRNMKLSPSQVESFYSCRFKYFCKYGIKAKERKPAVFDSLEYGSLIHYVLEKVFSDNVSMDELDEKVNKSLDEYLTNKLGGLKNKTERFKYLFSRLSSSIKIVVRYIFDKSMETEFKPVDFEIEVGDGRKITPMKFSIPGGGSVKVEGKIDRVDIMEKDNKVYLRVVDYKTSSKQFKLSDVVYGINMQMLIYLASLVRKGKQRYGDIVPAGVLYMPTSVPVANVERQENNTDDFDKKRLDTQFKMNGLILDDENVVLEMKKDSKTDTVVNLTEMGGVLKKVESFVVEMSKLIHEGNVEVRPSLCDEDACTYCAYSSVCEFEGDNDMPRMQKFSNEEAVKKIIGEE